MVAWGWVGSRGIWGWCGFRGVALCGGDLIAIFRDFFAVVGFPFWRGEWALGGYFMDFEHFPNIF